MIGRRELITMVGGAAAWPMVAPAQQSSLKDAVGDCAIGPLRAHRSFYQMNIREMSIRRDIAPPVCIDRRGTSRRRSDESNRLSGLRMLALD
jgi:hypothetical protein